VSLQYIRSCTHYIRSFPFFCRSEVSKVLRAMALMGDVETGSIRSRNGILKTRARIPERRGNQGQTYNRSTPLPDSASRNPADSSRGTMGRSSLRGMTKLSRLPRRGSMCLIAGLADRARRFAKSALEVEYGACAVFPLLRRSSLERSTWAAGHGDGGKALVHEVSPDDDSLHRIL
jgi:hypothetical protein